MDTHPQADTRPSQTDDATTEAVTHGDPELDAAVVERPSGLAYRRFGIKTMATTLVSGFLMGSADIVPGVSGGTVALVLGIYERLVANVRQGARAASLLVRGKLRLAMHGLGLIEWTFLAPLLIGIVLAVLTLASGLEHLLENEPVFLAAAFFGLVLGSAVVAYTEIDDLTRLDVHAVVLVSAVVTFFALGLRTGRFEDPSLLVVFGGGALAICAMILPGISGSFILLMIGLYEGILGAVNDRDVATIVTFAAGAAVGLGSFATLLNWLLRRYHGIVLAALIGLMLGSLRVLWPWPAGEDGVGDTALGAPTAGEFWPALGLMFVGAVAVIAIALTARALSEADDPS
ncbi:MAG: DUF368 domain-containing protein [Nitriliruptorales bacterium]|nr:DUF368 domain-containing protein [Nitriliruptorales bacterium]